MKKVVLTAAVTGAATFPSQSPHMDMRLSMASSNCICLLLVGIHVSLYWSRKTRFSTFPAADRGSRSTNATDLGFLKPAMCSLV